MIKGKDIPELGELVVGRIATVKNYGAYVELDDYPKVEALIHVSEVSLKWVRNIRDYLKEGQKNIFKVIRVDPDSMQVDISLRRVSKREREEKLLELKKKQKVSAILKKVSEKLNDQSIVNSLLEHAEGSPVKLYSFFEEIAEGRPVKEVFPFLDESTSSVLEGEVVDEIKPKESIVKEELVMRCEDKYGAEAIRRAVRMSEEMAGQGEFVEIKTKGAPYYIVSVKASSLDRASQLMEAVYQKCREVLSEYGGLVERKKP